MSKSIIDFSPRQWCPQTIASPARSTSKRTNARPQRIAFEGRIYFCFAMVVCVVIQVATFVSPAVADDDFGFIATEQPVCKNCVENNRVPSFQQTQYVIQDAPQQTSEIVSLDYVAQAPLAIGVELPVDQSGYEVAPTLGQAYRQSYSEGTSAIAVPVQRYVQTYTSAPATGSVQPGLAQQKAERAAQGRIQGHLGGGLGGARYEGVGWSNQSAQGAIQSCCYWGSRPTAQIGVSKGNDGFWYACVLYY